MSTTQVRLEIRESAGGLRRAAAGVGIPVGVVVVVLALAVGLRLSAYRGELTGLVQFGSSQAHVTHPPRGAPILSPTGYDGQFFYLQARDPLLLHDSTVRALRATGSGFRMQRAAYPALAFLLAGGRSSKVPLALLLANLLVLVGLATGFAFYARRRGWSTGWTVALALMPGMLLPVFRDLSDPLAVTSLVAGILCWSHRRRWPAALALTVAVLTREVMMLAVVAIAVEAGVGRWRERGSGTGRRQAFAQAWPVILIPSAAFAVWQAYITVRYGGPVGGAPLNLPLTNLVQEVRRAWRGYRPMAIWDTAYVVLIVAAVISAGVSLRRRVTVTSLAACAVSLGILVPALGDAWSDTRLSAPLFALLLLDGLQHGCRRNLSVGAAAAAMTIFIPLAIPGAF
ncbi:MAG TPA: hypothetical protein VF781_06180 [Solirubrobacteraceae bacterium]